MRSRTNGRHAWRHWLPIVQACWLVCQNGVALAEPSLRVQGDTRLQVQLERTGDHSVVVSGHLADELGVPVGDAQLSLELRPEGGQRPARLQVVTDPKGRFDVTIARAAERYHIDAAFAGDSFHHPARKQTTLELDRAAVEWSVPAPTSVLEPDATTHTLAATLRSSAGGDGLVVRAEQAGRVLATARSDERGAVTLTIPVANLETPRGTITLASDGDERRAQASIVHAYLQRMQPSLSLSLTRPPGRQSVRAQGRLSIDGAGVANQPIGLFLGEQHVRTAMTDHEGEIDLDLSTGDLATEVAVAPTLQARFVSNDQALADAYSEVRPIPTAPTRPSLAWLAVPLALVALSWWQQNRSRHAAATRLGADGQDRERPRAVVQGRAHTLARELMEVSGVVVDWDTGDPILDAELSLQALDPTDRTSPPTLLAPHAAFRLTAVVAGKYALVASKPGYEPTSVKLQVPHRGQWSGVQIRIRNLRNIMWDRGAALARNGASSSDAPPTWREIMGRLLAGRPDDRTLTHLASVVERLLYARDVPRREDVARATSEVAKTVEAMHPRDPK